MTKGNTGPSPDRASLCVEACAGLPDLVLKAIAALGGMSQDAACRALTEHYELAEEGAKEAFGVVVIAKQQIEAKSREQQRTIDSQGSVICAFRTQRDTLLDAVRNLRDQKGRHNTETAYRRLMDAFAKVEAEKAKL